MTVPLYSRMEALSRSPMSLVFAVFGSPKVEY